MCVFFYTIVGIWKVLPHAQTRCICTKQCLWSQGVSIYPRVHESSMATVVSFPKLWTHNWQLVVRYGTGQLYHGFWESIKCVCSFGMHIFVYNSWCMVCSPSICVTVFIRHAWPRYTHHPSHVGWFQGAFSVHPARGCQWGRSVCTYFGVYMCVVHTLCVH